MKRDVDVFKNPPKMEMRYLEKADSKVGDVIKEYNAYMKEKEPWKRVGWNRQVSQEIRFEKFNPLIRKMSEFKWVDDEVAEIKCECGEELIIDIYDFMSCKCGRKYKLKQSHEILEEKLINNTKPL